MVDFWIGDWVKILSLGKIGKFEGSVNKKAKIKLDKKLMLVSLSDIELLPEELIPDNIVKSSNDSYYKTVSKPLVIFNNVLDLHIEILAPKMINERAEMLVSYQVKQAKQYLNEAINRKIISVKIIHGKGIGALKMEIEHLLKSFPEVYFTKTVNNGGAIDVMFQY